MEEETLASWESFFEYLGAYQEKTHQNFKKRTSTSAKARNTEIRDRGKPCSTAGRGSYSQ
ncbi:hypothetical protein C6341_g15696, partial [Phytophthora cactorum]